MVPCSAFPGLIFRILSPGSYLIFYQPESPRKMKSGGSRTKSICVIYSFLRQQSGFLSSIWIWNPGTIIDSFRHQYNLIRIQGIQPVFEDPKAALNIIRQLRIPIPRGNDKPALR